MNKAQDDFPPKYVPGGVFGFNPSLAIEQGDGRKFLLQRSIFLVKNAGSWFWNIETEKVREQTKTVPGLLK